MNKPPLPSTVTNKSPAVTLPENIGRFQILRRLGQGAQGVVYLAHDPQLQRNVAIKTLRMRLKEQEMNLIQEAQAVSRLNHPNIISIYDIGEFDGRPYLVFEFVDGLTLKEYLNKNGPLSIARSLGLINQILIGITHAHENNILHGDLSPHNIIVDKTDLPRIMDFGISRFIGSRQDIALGMWGSLAYMSPEHFNNSPLTEKSDIFAIGLILFEMLINQPVIQADNDFAIINAIANHPIDPPSARNPELDKALDNLVMRALEKDPETRYFNAVEMHNAIEEYLQIENQQTSDKLDHDGKKNALEFLLRRMRFKMDFPALSHHIIEINRKATQFAQTSVADLANTILKDYGLTSKLLKLVNSSYYRRSSTKISTISRAVTLLGFEQVRTAALGLMLMDHIRNGKQRNDLKDEVISAFLNGAIGKEMAEKLRYKDPEEAFICSMFHNLGRMLALYYFPEEYEEIQALVERKGVSEDTATHAILGLSYEELGQGVAKTWHFPEKIWQSMESLPEGKVTKPSMETDILRLVSNFSKELSAAATSPDDKRHERLRHVTARFSSVLPVAIKNIDELLSTAAKNVHKYADVLNIRLEASQYFKLWNRTTTAEENTHPGLANHGMIEAVVPEETPERIMLDSIQEISNALLEQYNLNEILITILETIYRGFSFSHVLFCVLDKNRQTVNVRFGFGNEIEEITRGMRISLRDRPDIFNISLTQGRDMIITDVDEKTCSPFIPNWFRSLIPARTILIYPILVSSAPIGLIYADYDRAGALEQNSPLSLLKTLRNQAVMAIKQKASRVEYNR